jgi:outer membrane receptor protein involved in Fe transport
VQIVNGPFSAAYGDFSGLGVVHIRLRESLPDQLTLRLQGGSFGSFRSFLSYSPNLKNGDAFVAYEGSRTDGPFENPLRYSRDNVTANLTRHVSAATSYGFRFNGGRNDFNSSGQLPLDEVAAGQLDRFGYIDPTDGGHVRTGTLGAYFSHEGERGDTWKLDAFAARSLFDLYSNFTFFLNDPVSGDGIQQHDSRLQEGANAQYVRPQNFGAMQGLLTIGGNYHDNQINVGLYPRVGRVPTGVTTRADARVINAAGYLQENFSFLHGKLQVGGGIRYDEFRFDVADRVQPLTSGAETAGRLQPKANVAFTPSQRFPITFYANYGRGISTADARAVVERPQQQRVATTDFYQAGAAHHFSRVSLSADLFWIDRSHEQVYIPDDGSFEFKGPSRAYGFEAKSSVQITRHIAWNGAVMKVANAYYLGTIPRVYVDSAPHFVASSALSMSPWRHWTGSVTMRAINHYRLDGTDAAIVASGHTVFDAAVSRQIRRGVEVSLSVDNLTNRDYYETQNYFVSRLAEAAPVARIHGTPGYPLTLTAGVTFRLFGK